MCLYGSYTDLVVWRDASSCRHSSCVAAFQALGAGPLAHLVDKYLQSLQANTNYLFYPLTPEHQNPAGE